MGPALLETATDEPYSQIRHQLSHRFHDGLKVSWVRSPYPV